MRVLISAILLVASYVSGATYSDAFARTKMLPLSAAAYSYTPGACLQKVFQNATRQLEVHCDITGIYTCSGYTAVSHSDQAILLVYRGTNRNFELLVETEETLFENHVGTVYKLLILCCLVSSEKSANVDQFRHYTNFPN